VGKRQLAKGSVPWEPGHLAGFSPWFLGNQDHTVSCMSLPGQAHWVSSPPPHPAKLPLHRLFLLPCPDCVPFIGDLRLMWGLPSAYQSFGLGQDPTLILYK
jgi:hypothetical protein